MNYDDKIGKIQDIRRIIDDLWCMRYFKMLDKPDEPCEITLSDILFFVKIKMDLSNYESFVNCGCFIDEWNLESPYFVDQSDVCIDEIFKLFSNIK